MFLKVSSGPVLKQIFYSMEEHMLREVDISP